MVKLAWLVFGITCLLLTFMELAVRLIPESSSTLIFSGALCALALVLALLSAHGSSFRNSLPALVVPLILLILASLSAWYSPTQSIASFGSVALVASSPGGFWSARLLPDTTHRQSAFTWLCTGLLAGVLIVSFWSYVSAGNPNEPLYSNPHALVSMLILLAFTPLALISRGKMLPALLGVFFLGVTYAALYLCGLSTSAALGVFIPLVMILVAGTAASHGSDHRGEDTHWAHHGPGWLGGGGRLQLTSHIR